MHPTYAVGQQILQLCAGATQIHMAKDDQGCHLQGDEPPQGWKNPPGLFKFSIEKVK